MDLLQVYLSSASENSEAGQKQASSEGKDDEIDVVGLCEIHFGSIETTNTIKKNTKGNRRISKPLARSELLNECKCKVDCTNIISCESRQRFNEKYWLASFEDQKKIILQHVNQRAVKRRRSGDDIEPQKKRAFDYHLPNDSDELTKVCQSIFLNTLGYKSCYSHVVYRCFNADANLSDGRGRFERKPSKLTQDMIDDIFSYEPCVHHYRREHAPNVLYLPTDLNVQIMYNNWEIKRREQNLDVGSYSTYAKLIRENKIHFVKLGHEECEDCILFGYHEEEVNHSRRSLTDRETIECPACLNWFDHHQRAIAARTLYKSHARLISLNCLTVSVDLQKVN